MCVLYEKNRVAGRSRLFGLTDPYGPSIIPNMDLQYDSNSKCAPPRCGSEGGIDKRDFGLAMTGCEKTFVPAEPKKKKQENPQRNYFDDLDDEFMKYTMRNGAETPFREVYESYSKLQQLVHSTPKDTLYEKTQNPRRRNFLTTTY